MRQPPPVGQSNVQAPDRQVAVQERRMSTSDRTYLEVQALMKGNTGEARAIRGMFGNDKQLVDRFLSVAFSLLAKESTLLQEATPMSIIEAIKTAAAMGLEPFTDDGVIVHHKGIAVFRPMYRGYLKRIRNSGKVVDIDCQVVYENDEFALRLGTEPAIHHVPAASIKDEQGKVVEDRGGYKGVYAWALMPSGKYIIEWMEEAEINQVRDQYGQKFSRGGQPLPWVTAYAEMARKTVIRRLSKRLPQKAVDDLLAADSRADSLEQELKQEQDSHIEDLRLIAMRATGQPIPTDPTTAPAASTEAQPEAAVQEGTTAQQEGPQQGEEGDPLGPLMQ